MLDPAGLIGQEKVFRYSLKNVRESLKVSWQEKSLVALVDGWRKGKSKEGDSLTGHASIQVEVDGHLN